VSRRRRPCCCIDATVIMTTNGVAAPVRGVRARPLHHVFVEVHSRARNLLSVSGFASVHTTMRYGKVGGAELVSVAYPYDSTRGTAAARGSEQNTTFLTHASSGEQSRTSQDETLTAAFCGGVSKRRRRPVRGTSTVTSCEPVDAGQFGDARVRCVGRGYATRVVVRTVARWVRDDGRRNSGVGVGGCAHVFGAHSGSGIS
jgi:hypothetical protein